MGDPKIAIGLGFLSGALNARELHRLSSRHHRRQLSDGDLALLDGVLRDAIDIASGVMCPRRRELHAVVWNWRAFSAPAAAA